MKHLIYPILFFFLLSFGTQAQKTTVEYDGSIFFSGKHSNKGWEQELNLQTRRVEFPFEYKNNFIVIDVIFNKSFPLKFIFDTGAEHSILTRREITDIMRIPYRRRFTVLGSDMKTELTAYLITHIHLKIAHTVMNNKALLVLEEDYFKFEEMTGVKIHGILGADLFKGFIVKIDYQRQKITLYSAKYFNLDDPEDWIQHPINIQRHKPYFNTNIDLMQDTTLDVKLLLDTGASLPLLINTNTHPSLKPPENAIAGNVGVGLGGHLEGFVGRVESIDLAGMQMKNVLTSFQELSPELDTTFLNGRNGIIGNEILSRFTVIIDYPRELLYLKPNSRFKKAFKYDRSGLVLIATGSNLNTITVQRVVPNSPADRAGLQKGDVLKAINGFPIGLLGLSGSSNIFKKREGKKIKLKVKRNKKKLKKVFYLENLI